MRIFTKIALLVLLLFSSAVSMAQSYNVTFRVDMSQYSGLGASDTVYVNGTWNSWCGKCNFLVKQGSTAVWEGTFSIPSGIQEFKYTINGWSAQESLSSGLPCTVTNSGFTNRTINVTAITSLPLVCWNSCSACVPLAQVNLPVDFDSSNVNYALTDFGGNISTITADPVVSTNKVAKVTKPTGAELWAGTTIGNNGFSSAIPFSSNATKMSMRVYSPDTGIAIRFKVEDVSDPTKSVETETKTTIANAWQTLEFNFANHVSGTAPINFAYVYKKASVFFNFGVTGTAAGTKVYYFDDVKMVPPSGPVLAQIKLPINFDSSNVNYSMTDFGGNASSVAVDPSNSANKAGKVIKSNTAELWAGTTIGTSTGLAEPIPFVAGSTKMRVRVWSPDSGIVVRLKAEVLGDPTKSVETDARTKTSNAWELLEFDFANQAAGTSPINFTYTYKMLSIFFNFGITGTVAGTKTYYFDDVAFGAGTPPPPPANKVNVKFSVDVKNLTLMSTDTVTINGTFNGWCGLCNPLTNIPGTKIWTTTIALDTNVEYEYKFTIGNWAKQENLAAGLPCTKTSGSFTNRKYKSGTTHDSIPVVCWETCNACSSGGPTKTNVTFMVDMSKHTINATDTVTLNGTFNSWCGACTPMTRIGTSKIWAATVLLDKDSTYDYKYTIGNWASQEILAEGLPCTTTKSGFTNRTVLVNQINDTLPVVCWESCVDCENTKPKAKVTFQVNMKDYLDSLTKGVTLNGTFNGWCGACTPMTSIGNNIYSVTLSLDTGSYEFKYTIGNWDDQEQFSVTDPCTKTVGTFTNRFKVISDTNAVLVGPYCWNTCTICNSVGLNESILNQVKLYPNPATDMLSLDFGQMVNENIQVNIYNLLGDKVMEEKMKAVQQQNLDIQSLTPGIYLVKIEMDQALKSYKLIVE